MDYPRGARGGANRGDSQRVTAAVKWFNRTKGFGFVSPSDGSDDIFLPANALAQAGYDEVGEGATIICDVVEGPKGKAVANVIDVDQSTATVRGARGQSGSDRPRPYQQAGFARNAPSGPTQQLQGIVKWFDVTRGFGFITPSDGGKDVFVHLTALRRSGLETLATGQNVYMAVQEAQRGREASSVELA
jgi:CspA family cold shock protein